MTTLTCAICPAELVYQGRGRPPRSCVPCRPAYKRLCRARWREANPTKQPNDGPWPAIKHKYGLTKQGWHDILVSQAGRCAICTAAMRSPYVDHCHETGRVRGFLCTTCNAGLGMLGDNVAGLRRALAYLEQS